MRGMIVEQLGGPEQLVLGELPEPALEPGRVLMDVRAAGCNFFDLLICAGKYQLRPEPPFAPGGEVAGVVREVARDVTGVTPGQRVLASVPYGGFAERVSAPAAAVHRIPDSLSFEAAAALPVVYGTAHAALVHRGRVRAGDWVLVSAAAGGVGLASVQLARALGARVIALAGGERKLEVAREAGAEAALDYHDPDWVDAVKQLTGGHGVDVVIENVGGEVFDGCTRCLAWDARLVVVGFASGNIPSIAANRVLLKHVAVVGVHWGPMLQHQPGLVAETFQQLFQLLEAGAIEPLLWRVFPLQQAQAALVALRDRQSVGKIVLRVAD